MSHTYPECEIATGRAPGVCEDHPRRTRHIDCSFCQANPTGMMPSHDASDRCESGKHKHCTCDVCF